jgi:hypothetical protein
VLVVQQITDDRSAALRAGASNDKQDKELVHFTMSGDNAKIDEMIAFMRSGKELNSWGAKVRVTNTSLRSRY